jgi:chromosome segregation ATPase
MAEIGESIDRLSASLQALLAQITEKQRQISLAREGCRTLVKPSELREAQQEIQDGIDEVTTICKRVKVNLDELDLINAELLSDDHEEVSREENLQRWTQSVGNPLDDQFNSEFIDGFIKPHV